MSNKLTDKLNELFNLHPEVKTSADSVQATLEQMGVTSKESDTVNIKEVIMTADEQKKADELKKEKMEDPKEEATETPAEEKKEPEKKEVADVVTPILAQLTPVLSNLTAKEQQNADNIATIKEAMTVSHQTVMAQLTLSQKELTDLKGQYATMELRLKQLEGDLPRSFVNQFRASQSPANVITPSEAQTKAAAANTVDNVPIFGFFNDMNSKALGH